MEIRVAGEEDIRHLAGLLVRFADEEDMAAVEQIFAEHLLGWWRAHNESHVPFLATLSSTDAVGMAWLAVTARVPRPGGLPTGVECPKGWLGKCYETGWPSARS
jgi:hypothetical protein